MNFVLSSDHGYKIAVILNEFGDSMDIERSQLTTNDANDTPVEDWLELRNGCLCCSVKDAGVKAIETLMERKGKFDYILLETTGLADPGPIAGMFWLDDELQSDLFLDGIVTVVDAKFGASMIGQDQLSPHAGNEFYKQIAAADRILLNKMDLAAPEDVQRLKLYLNEMNALAPIVTSERSQIPSLKFMLDIKAYSFEGEDVQKKMASLSTSHHHPDPLMASIYLTVPCETPINLNRCEEWFQELLWEKKVPGTETKVEVVRLKSMLYTEENEWHVVQGVCELYEIQKIKTPAEPQSHSRIVLIGKGLDIGELDKSLKSCLKN